MADVFQALFTSTTLHIAPGDWLTGHHAIRCDCLYRINVWKRQLASNPSLHLIFSAPDRSRPDLFHLVDCART
jgi:hypothetical protein